MSTVKEKSIVFMFLKGAKKDRYGTLMYNLKSQYARGVDHYPTTLSQALQLLSTHKTKSKPKQEDDNSSNGK